MMINVFFFVAVVKEKFYQGKKHCFTLSSFAQSNFRATFFKEIFRAHLFFAQKNSRKNNNFAQPFVRAAAVRENLVN